MNSIILRQDWLQNYGVCWFLTPPIFNTNLTKLVKTCLRHCESKPIARRSRFQEFISFNENEKAFSRVCKTYLEKKAKKMNLSEKKHLSLQKVLHSNNNVMCTIILSYDQNNALARRKLAALLDTGLFVKKDVTEQPLTAEEQSAHRREVEAFLFTSKRNMADIIARNV